MKMHRNTSEIVVQSLESIFAGNRHADRVVERALNDHVRWGARDRRFVAGTVYDIVRWCRWYRALSGADTSDYWQLLGVWCVLNGVSLPKWPEFEGFDAEAIRRRAQEHHERAVCESIPDWMDQLGVAELGVERWTQELRALNEEAPVVLRVNRLKTEPEALREKLERRNVVTRLLPGFPDALELERRQNVFSLPEFRGGLFEVQDAASQLVAPWLRVAPGMRVVDACAGAGGKTLHLAALMQNQGRIIAMDPESRKLNELSKRARRAGVHNVETLRVDRESSLEQFVETADRVLLDVPCSGMGVLKRTPDAKWKLSPEVIESVRNLQREILQVYPRMLKPGGLMVYSTCSILPSENEQQVTTFLSSYPGFTLVSEKHALPSEGYDGFYMALLRKEGS